MKIYGSNMGDSLLQMIYRLPKERIIKKEGIPCIANVDVTSAFLAYRDPYDAHGACRPYMQISGKCSSLSGIMPLDVTELDFDNNNCMRVTYCYEFSDDELAEMTLKGLFRPNFKVPDVIYDNILELPVVCDFRAVVPEKGEHPILFANITNRHNMVIDTESCGYRFGEYFKEPDSVRVEGSFEEVNFANIFANRDHEVAPTYEQEDVAEAVIAEAQKSIEQKALEAEFAAIKKHYEARKKLSEHEEDVVEDEPDVHGEIIIEDSPLEQDDALKREVKRQATRINEFENAIDDVVDGEFIYDTEETPRDEAITERIDTLAHHGKKPVPVNKEVTTEDDYIDFDTKEDDDFELD